MNTDTPQFEFSDDPARLDRDRVQHWLSEESYWALGRDRAVQDRAIEGSLNFGMYRDGEQVAYARIVTDGATFAWLCDVYVDASVRSLGVGVALIAGVMDALEPLGLGRVALATRDAHGLYRKFGFDSLDEPQKWMTWGGK
ncbi:MAG: acetyltransferase [Rhodoglobus sp.]|nr:acetyltransferase [Rhodoglobus sp.]